MGEDRVAGAVSARASGRGRPFRSLLAFTYMSSGIIHTGSQLFLSWVFCFCLFFWCFGIESVACEGGTFPSHPFREPFLVSFTGTVKGNNFARASNVHYSPDSIYI